MTGLEPGVWPATATLRHDGHVEVGGLALAEVVAEHGTPAFVIDEHDFRTRCRAYRQAFADAEVFYAGKAFLCTTVARWVEEEGLSLDVCTGGELAVALRAGFPPGRIGMHGNNKSESELTRAVEAGVGRVIVDSFVEIERLAKIAAERDVVQPVMVRITVGVEAHTHEFVATAHEDQKFGFSMASGDVYEAVRRVLAAPSLRLLGLHSHIGSQIFDTHGFEVAAHRVTEALVAIRDEHGITLPELDLGGGLGIAYTAADDPADVSEVADSLRAIVARECTAAGLPLPKLSVEPGRAIVGPTTVTVYEVGTVKDVDGIRTYVSVDGGMSDNIRTALYDAEYVCRLAARDSAAPPMLARVVGKHCESGDIVVRDVQLPSDVQPGDLLAVPATGAYCRSMASNYNHVPRPPVIAVDGGLMHVIVRRETEDDLLALDTE